ncbi:MAG: hypothetical protein LBI82_01160 [Dysgonamonadaceae bacterium]|jgi:hypothetical protein|nr:hypothetical protein [Dysgonamonadaceae bacterium]
MKKYYFLFSIISIVLMTLSLSCGAAKPPKGSVMPCSGPEYRENSEFFRATAPGIPNADERLARTSAIAAARAELASSINTLLTRTMEIYQNSFQTEEVSETKTKIDDITRLVVAEKISGSRIICDFREVPTKKNNKYKFYITVELAKNDIVKAMQKQMTEAEYEKFRRIYDEEMRNAR